MVDIQTISIVLASASVIAGVVYYAFQIRHQNKMRNTDLVIRLADSMRSAELVAAFADMIGAEFKDYDDFVKKYGMPFSRNQVPMSFVMVGNLFEEVGVLFSNRLLDAHLVYQILPVSVAWQKMEPVIKGMLKEYGVQAYYEWFEYLYNEMQKREQKLQQSTAKGE
jgi:hypothetical protein